ncbi:hypothetical protein YC2023_055023 [Brassica napus]
MNQRLSRILDERPFSESTIIEIYPAIFSFYHFLLFGFVDQVQHPFICYGLKSVILPLFVRFQKKKKSYFFVI